MSFPGVWFPVTQSNFLNSCTQTVNLLLFNANTVSYHKYSIFWKTMKKIVISMVFPQIIAVLSIAFPSKIIYLFLMIVETLLSLCHKIYVKKFCVTHTVTGHLVTLAFSRPIAVFWKGFGGLNSTDMLKHLSLRVNFVKRQNPVVNFMVTSEYERGPVVHLSLFQLTLLLICQLLHVGINIS